ncbi:hypothetical protein [Candidatus Carsonella ruddii]|uniref:Putative ribosomal protein L25 n=1 Tax=Candidatus Carsonella ruddii PC isolate NHV TaxID=1202540 RepID=J3TEN4_CARRU|nr:hypothetical protein [Candidatus Carsonella ruddii]AFP84267.1 putative ribosomal protein L25 [Candidatus Carsonella ruddii PC isolate NHV]
MKFKFKIKIYKKKKTNKKIIPGTLFKDNNIFFVYILKNNLIKKVFKSSFLNVFYFNKIIKVYIENVKYSFTKNLIISFSFKELLFLMYKIRAYNNLNNYTNKIDFLCENYFPRKIKLNIYKLKKNFKHKDFNFKFKINKVILLKKNLII